MSNASPTPPLSPFQKLVVATWTSIIVLIFVGAIVRATGAGLGCPDWPTCWGCWVPPTSVDEVDFERLNLERFRTKAERFGIDPSTITEETLREHFNPVHVWTEYINRLTSLPVGFLSLLTAIFGFQQAKRHGRWLLAIGGLAALIVVLINAWLGRQVVLSGLQPGIITWHMALAILLLGMLVFLGWHAETSPRSLSFKEPTRLPLLLGISLLILTIFEGLMGSQVREMTDELAKVHADTPRSAWTAELEQTWMYVVHRSFSWVVLGTAVAFFLVNGKTLLTGNRWLEKAILGLVISQMFLGLILSHVGILAVAQVLHIGLSSLLVSGLFLWILLGSRRVQTA